MVVLTCVLWILLAIVLFFIIASLILFIYIEHRNNIVVKQVDSDHPLYADGLAFLNSDLEEWQIVTREGFHIKAWYLAADKATHKTVIMATGYNSIRDRFAGIAWMFHTLGYNVLLTAHRASTESEGKWLGFGWLDREDFKRWIDLVLEKNPQTEIALWGLSMGASTVMMLSGDELPDEVKAIIEDCGYDSLWNEIASQVKRFTRLPAFPLVSLMSLWSKVFAGYSWKEASATKQLAKNTRPMLLIHGDEDVFVPFKMLDKNVAAVHSPKEVLVVPKAGHGQAYEKAVKTYRETIRKFLEKYMK